MHVLLDMWHQVDPVLTVAHNNSARPAVALTQASAVVVFPDIMLTRQALNVLYAQMLLSVCSVLPISPVYASLVPLDSTLIPIILA
jgi:hypothetical protein